MFHKRYTNTPYDIEGDRRSKSLQRYSILYSELSQLVYPVGVTYDDPIKITNRFTYYGTICEYVYNI